LKKAAYILFFLSVFLLFWNTGISNRTEADDAFEYAWQVEHNGVDWLYHPHHLLYGAVTKDLYNGARLLGYHGRAYPMLCLLSALCGAGAVLMFFRFCYRRFSMRPVSSLLCSGLLMFSYGFWRYANEAEVIIPACFIMLCALYFAVSPRQTAAGAACAGIFCGISVLFHVLNGIPVFLAVPLFYLLYKNWKGLLIHLVCSIGVVVAGYAGIFLLESDQVLSSAGIRPALESGFLFKGLVGFSQCVISSNFMLGYQAVRDALVSLFPSRMLLEELYMGRGLPGWLVIGGSVTLFLFSVFLIGTTAFALYLLFRKESQRKRDRVGTADGWRTLVVTVVWFFGYAGAVLILEPGNPEVWVMGLVPFWLVFCGLVVAPLSKQNVLWPVLALTGLLAFHNYLGGMLPLKDPKGDYNQQKADWIFRHVKPEDMVLTADNPVFERYLRYYCPAREEYLHFWNDDGLERPEVALRALGLRQKTGTVYFLGDVFNQPVSLTLRFPEKTANIARFAQAVRPFVFKIADNEFGGIYALRPEYSGANIPSVWNLPGSEESK
jgi:hypothetical protein